MKKSLHLELIFRVPEIGSKNKLEGNIYSLGGGGGGGGGHLLELDVSALAIGRFPSPRLQNFTTETNTCCPPILQTDILK